MTVPSRLLRSLCFCLAGCALVAPLQAQVRPPEKPFEALNRLNDSVDALIRKVSPSVVQILVTGFGAVDGPGMVVGKQHSIGSGFVIDAEGYIITNAHVVKNAQQVQILLPETKDHTLEASLSSRNRVMPARILGISGNLDLALLKVENLKLPPLKLAAYDRLRQGEMALAFGSPEGLRNTVTMGIVSNVARQTDPDSAMVFIQTDASINPGNSGGPLVNSNGEVMGVNAFILTQSGGSEGLGFAIPSSIVDVFYRQVKKTGHLRRAVIGIGVQAIHPTMAEGLRLAQDFGVIVSDVAPGSPADQAGVHIGDVLLSINGKVVESVPFVAFYLMTRETSATVKLEVMRAGQKLTFSVAVIEPSDPVESYSEVADPEKSVVLVLGILGVEIDAKFASKNPNLRDPFGILVVAHAADSQADVPLEIGDVIRAVNGAKVATLEQLRSALQAVSKGGAVVLQIQREQRLVFVSFSLDHAE